MFVFYTITDSDFKMGMIEILLDDNKEDSEQHVLDWGELTMPTSDNDNFGPLNLGGGDKYLLVTFDKFDKINAYTLCSYK